MHVFCWFLSVFFLDLDNFPCFFCPKLYLIGNLVVYMAMTQSGKLQHDCFSPGKNRVRCTASGAGPRQYSSKQSEQTKIREKCGRKSHMNHTKAPGIQYDFNGVVERHVSRCRISTIPSIPKKSSLMFCAQNHGSVGNDPFACERTYRIGETHIRGKVHEI